MKLFQHDAEVDISAISGVFSVTVHPNPHWFWLALEAALIVGFAGYSVRAWHGISLLTRAVFVWADVAAIIGWVYQFTGSETIEVNAQCLTIRKEILGWNKIREYRIEDCTALELHHGGEESYGLQCRAGWRTIKFGAYLSEAQANQVLTALQRELPEVAQRLGTSTEGKKHFTTLGLSTR